MCHAANSVFYSALQCGTRVVLLDGSALYFFLQNRYSLRIHISHKGCGNCQIQTDTKPIGICSEILSCLCTYTLPHMYVQLRLNFSSRALLKSCCVSCSKFSFFSALQCGTRFFLLDGPALYLLFAKPIQLENPPLSYRMWPGASLRPIQNR